jgi:septal ring factor EnvC (AmiA/AmiB activator)
MRAGTALPGLMLAAALAAPATIALAQAPAGQSEVRKTLDSRRNELESAETRAKSLQQDVRDIAEQREKLNQRLLETAALIQKSEARLSAIEARIGELEAQEKLLQGSLAQRHDQIAKLLSALLRMGRNPPPVVVTKREDALQMVRSAMLLASAFPELKEQALALAERLNELIRVMTDIRTEGERLKVETTRLNDARTRLTGLMDSKKQSLAERQAELEEVRKTAASISKSVGELNELIVQLDKAVTANTGLGAYEQEVKAKAAEPKPEAAPAAVAQAQSPSAPQQADMPSVAVAAAAPALKDTKADGLKPEKDTQVAALAPPKSSVIELAPSGAITGNPGRIKPAIPFHLAKTRLPMPAQGRRVLSFGEKTQYGGQSKGLVLETRTGAQITSPCDGWIVYAGEFRSYGQLLIINAGGGYHVLLAGLSQIDVQPGQFVLAAEPIGTMSGSPGQNAAAKTQTSAPVLYVEFRKEGRPVDPDPWWVETRQEGHQKVQG